MRASLFGTLAGGATFSPSDIAGLTLWLKADAITGKVDGDPVSTWVDSSGNSNDATAGTDDCTYKTNQVNGLPAVRFIDPTNTNKTWMTTPSIPTIAAWTAFAVLKDYNTVPAYVLCAGSDTTSIIENFTAGKYEYYSTPRTVLGNTSTSVFSQLTCAVGSTATGVWTIGGETTHVYGNLTGMTLAEWIAYNSALSAPNIASVQGYLTTKYGV